MPNLILGVKELVENGMDVIPDRFVKAQQFRAGPPKEPVVGQGIPLVDLLNFQGVRKAEIVQAIADAAGTWGFFQVVNHGVSASVVKAMKDASVAFFDLPLEDKMLLYTDDIFSPLRYCSSFAPSTEERLDWHDNLTVASIPEPWPELPGFSKKAVVDYIESMDTLAATLAEAFALGLGLEPHNLKCVHAHAHTRLNYYPPCPTPELAIGISPHSDFGGFTVLLQDEVGGLQIKKNGDWYAVKPMPDSFVINVADQLEVLSNGRYQSAEHRAVVNTKLPRLSFATFYLPLGDTFIAPHEELVSDENPPRYKGNLFGEYLKTQMVKRLQSKTGVAALKIGSEEKE